MARKLSVRASKTPAITITRAAVRERRLVYVAVANKKIFYAKGSSKIVYIGMTKKGANRIAASAANKAVDMLPIHGITCLMFYVVVCEGRQRVPSWRRLERALILTFKDKFGEPPRCNMHGKKMIWTPKDNYFTKTRLANVIDTYSK